MAQQQLEPIVTDSPAKRQGGRWVWGVAIMLAVAVAGAVLGWHHSKTSSPGDVSTSPVITFRGSDVQFAGLLRGSMLTLHQGCLLYDGRPIAWPAGSTWDPAAKVVTVPADDGGTRRIQTGRVLPATGGGSVPLESLKEYESVYAALSRCAEVAAPGTDVFIVSAVVE